MLDIMLIFSTGEDLGALASPTKTVFEQCYHEVFEPNAFGQIVLAINSAIPIRWLPLDANRRFLRATETVRNRINEIVEERIRIIQEKKKRGASDHKHNGEFKDMLTFMVEEKHFGAEKWSVTEMTNQVSALLSLL